MTIEQKKQFKNRLKGLIWSIGMMSLALTTDWLVANILLFNLPNELTVILGLVLAQISKHLNSK